MPVLTGAEEIEVVTAADLVKVDVNGVVETTLDDRLVVVVTGFTRLFPLGRTATVVVIGRVSMGILERDGSLSTIHMTESGL